MNKARILVLSLLILLLTWSPVKADFDYADSPEFALDLLSFPPGGAYDYADSSNFSLDLYPVNRGWSDSPVFSFDPLAYDQPAPGENPLCQLPDPVELRDNLWQYNPSCQSWIPLDSDPAPGIIILLCHGWNDSPASFLSKSMAQTIHAAVPSAVILTWHWGDGPYEPSKANPNGLPVSLDFSASLLNCLNHSYPPYYPICLFVQGVSFSLEIEQAMANARAEGENLGKALATFCVNTTEHQIHMIGHSFGGIVCAEAAKRLMADDLGNNPIKQLTTLDTPKLNWTNCINPDSAERIEVIFYNWVPDIIHGGTGGPLNGCFPNVLNFELQASHYPSCTLPSCTLHECSMDWYVESINTLANCDGQSKPYGFGWSFSLNPSDPQWQDTGYWTESETAKGCLADLRSCTFIDVIVHYSHLAMDNFDSAASWMGKTAYLIYDDINPCIQLSNESGILMASQNGDIQILDENIDSYIFKTVYIPRDAECLMLDAKFTNIVAGDVLTISIEQENVLIFDPIVQGASGVWQTLPEVPVGQYAGQNVTLQIALRNESVVGGTVLIDNLTFSRKTFPADLNSDTYIDVIDLQWLVAHWLQNNCFDPDYCDSADINHDNRVDLTDYSILVQYWLESVPSRPSADFDGSWSVDMIDFAIFADSWADSNCQEPDWCQGLDIDQNGAVDILDLSLFAENWLD